MATNSKLMRKCLVVFLMMMCCIHALAQDVGKVIDEKKVQKNKKGEIYLFWGYNRDTYSKSTIRFQNTETDNYDFTFMDAKAHDKADMEHFYRINEMTIPQYNFHVGYFFNDKHDLGVELSWDHLKYVVTDFQSMRVTGQIRGRQIDKDTVVTPDFVHLQHTNGNNYLMVNILKRLEMFNRNNIRLSLIGKVGIGALYSFTISTVLGEHDEGPFYYQGTVAGVGANLRLDLGRYFFLETALHGAFANYYGTKVGYDHKGTAKHHFFSGQYIYGVGFNYPLTR